MTMTPDNILAAARRPAVQAIIADLDATLTAWTKADTHRAAGVDFRAQDARLAAADTLLARLRRRLTSAVRSVNGAPSDLDRLAAVALARHPAAYRWVIRKAR
jgi:hypothetical protein